MDGDAQTIPTDTGGSDDNSKIPEVNTKVQPNDGEAPLEMAERINKEKTALLEREEKLMDRKEKMWAEEKVGGRAIMGKETVETKDPKAYGKSIMAGKLPEKKDE